MFVGRRPANRYWRRRAHVEENPETPFIGLHMQILGSTRVEHHLLEDMIRMGGELAQMIVSGTLIGQKSQTSCLPDRWSSAESADTAVR